MGSRRTWDLVLATAVVAGLSTGCFGNCGGCVGDKLGESFEALDGKTTALVAARLGEPLHRHLRAPRSPASAWLYRRLFTDASGELVLLRVYPHRDR